MPALWAEAQALLEISPQNHHSSTLHVPNLKTGKTLPQVRRYQWVNQLSHQNQSCNALFHQETFQDQTIHFAHLTNWHLDAKTIESFAQAARQRWKIENQGFNVLKNGGFHLEHAYSRNIQAAKNYFYLMLLAFTLQQLMVKGSLISSFHQQIKTCKNFAIRLAQDLKNLFLPQKVDLPAQIRFSSA
jgi:hypothetical protein